MSGYRGKSSWRASVTLDNCRIGGNKIFGAGAGPQSELTLTKCTFDGTDKTNIYHERGAIVRNDATTPEGSPAAEDSTETEKASDSDKPSQHKRTQHKRPAQNPAEDIHRFFRRLLPPP